MDPDASYTAEEWLAYYAARERDNREREADEAIRLAEFQQANLEARRLVEQKKNIATLSFTLIPQPLDQPSCGICWLNFTDCAGERPAVKNNCECKTVICMTCTMSIKYKCPFCRYPDRR